MRVSRRRKGLARPLFQQPPVGLQQALGAAAVEPLLYGNVDDLFALVHHHLQRVGQLDFPPGADARGDHLLQRPEEAPAVLR